MRLNYIFGIPSMWNTKTLLLSAFFTFLLHAFAVAGCLTAGDTTLYVDANSQITFDLPVANANGDFTTALGNCLNGTVTRTPGTTSTVTYTPRSNYYGPDSFTYVIKSADAACSESSLGTVNINPCPKAMHGTVNRYNTRSVTFDLPIAHAESGFVITSLGSRNGAAVALVPGTTQTVTYTQGKNATPSDIVTYSIQPTASGDSGCGNSIGEIRVVVPPPVAGDSIVYLNSTETTSIPAPITPNGHTLDLGELSTTNGSASWSTASLYSINYTPNPKSTDNVLISYSVNYMYGFFPASVSGTILINPCPRALPGTFENRGTTITFELPVQYPDRPFPLSLGQPANGTVSRVAGTTGTVTYVKNPTHFGPDTFSYTVGIDGKAGCMSSTAEITVDSIRAPKATCPDANDAAAIVTAGTSVTIELPVDGKPSSVQVDDPPNGTATADVPFAQNSIIYTPDPGFTGVDTFVYSVSGGFGCPLSTGTLTVGVVTANGCPTASPLSLNTGLGETANETLAPGYVADPDGDVVSTWLLNPPAHGTAAISTAGQLTYTPEPGYTGQDGFTYKVTDGTCSAEAPVSVNVINDASIETWHGYE